MMMVKHFSYLLLIVLLACCKPDDKSVKEPEYYAFINDVLTPNRQRILLESPDTFTLHKDYLKRRILTFPYVTFSQEDKDFILLQYDKAQTFKWSGDSLKNTLVVSDREIEEYKKTGWPKIKYDIPGPGFYQYALPLFTLDRTRCIFSFGYHCGGECGRGNTSLYQWTGSKWVKVFDFGGWVS